MMSGRQYKQVKITCERARKERRAKGKKWQKGAKRKKAAKEEKRQKGANISKN